MDVREHLVSQLLESREIGLGGIELEDDRVSLPHLEAFGPHRLRDGKHPPIDRIGDLSVQVRLSISELGQLVGKSLHLDDPFVDLDLLAADDETFERDR
jgi:hypothetical protein